MSDEYHDCNVLPPHQCFCKCHKDPRWTNSHKAKEKELPMTEPTPREELPTIDKVLRSYRSPNESDEWELFRFNQAKAQLTHIINAEVLAVLDKLEDQAEPVDYKNVERGKTIPSAVRVTAITQLKQRYGGKEQENE